MPDGSPPPLYKPELLEEKKKLTLLQHCYKEPWIPIGCIVTVGALSVGFHGFINGNKVQMQSMMRLRVVAHLAEIASTDRAISVPRECFASLFFRRATPLHASSAAHASRHRTTRPCPAQHVTLSPLHCILCTLTIRTGRVWRPPSSESSAGARRSGVDTWSTRGRLFLPWSQPMDQDHKAGGAQSIQASLASSSKFPSRCHDPHHFSRLPPGT